MLQSRRWWTVAVLGIAIVLSVLLLIKVPTPTALIGGFASITAFVIAWFAVGRLALENPTAARIYLPLLIAITTVGTAFDPTLATMQCIAFPLLWSVIDSSARSIIASAVLCLATGVGLYLRTGSLIQGVAIEVVAFGLSVSLGLWISSIAQLSHERKRLLDELTAAQDQLAVLNRESGVTSERERLAREIHDTIAQDLTGLVMLTQRTRRELAAGNSAVADEQLELLEESARNALAETRALVASSAPVALTSGITDALERLAQRFSRETGLTVGVEVGDIPPLERDTEVVLLRVAQEGLANIRKHAGAESAVIELTLVAGKPTLAVRDDGAGFDVAARSNGFGLGGMRDRLALVGGSLDVASSSTGTTLTATLPAGAHS